MYLQGKLGYYQWPHKSANYEQGLGPGHVSTMLIKYPTLDLAVFLWSWEHFAWVDFVPCLDLADHSNLSKFIYLLWHSQFSNQIIVIFVTLAMWHDTQKALFAVSFNWANSKATRLGLKYILVHSLLQSFLVLQI